MNLYFVSQKENTGYETYDSFVCQARTEREARYMLADRPDSITNIVYKDRGKDNPAKPYEYDEWIRDVDKITVVYLGVSTDISGKPKVICSSFNAG